jgi:hypothetical protein
MIKKNKTLKEIILLNILWNEADKAALKNNIEEWDKILDKISDVLKLNKEECYILIMQKDLLLRKFMSNRSLYLKKTKNGK